MMKGKVTMLIPALLVAAQGFAQWTLKECYEKAEANYPLIRQYGLLEQTKGYTLENIATNYLPKFTLGSQATYQSDVTTLPVDFKALGIPVDIPSVSKGQYKVVADVSQAIWDGGQTAAQRSIAKAANEVEKKRTDVSLYAVREKVRQLFFGILAVNERLKILDLKEADLHSNQSVLEALLKNGTAMQSDLDRIRIARLQLEQSRTEQAETQKAFCRALSLFIRQEVSGPEALVKPSPAMLPQKEGLVSRPELRLFEAQTLLIEKHSGAITARLRPVVSLFAQGGYGRPGLNMLEESAGFFALGGLRLSWNFGNFYTRKNEQRILQSNIRSIDLQRETFLLNTQLQLTQDQAEVEKNRRLLLRDEEIVGLRERIKQAGESKYKNGVYTLHELLQDINAEEEARQTKALHEIQYLLHIHNYLHTEGE